MNQLEIPVEPMSIALSEDTRTSLTAPLNEVLADLHILYVKARNYHWNIVGDQFFGLHAEFEKLYDDLSEDIDAVAERTRALGGTALGSMKQFLALASLKEDPTVPQAKAMVANLQADYETMVARLRGLAQRAGELGDAGTEDFCIGMMAKFEKTAWMLRSFGS